MSKVLITFLGRSPKGENGYRRTSYQFPDGTVSSETAMLGVTLAERYRCDKLVVLGTAGSMWDYFVENLVQLSPGGEEARVALMEATGNKGVQQHHLDEVQPLVSRNMGRAVHLEVIPYGVGEAEQVSILESFARHVEPEDQLLLDVTHGFRHIPMLGLMAGLYLRAVRGVQVEGVYYGFFDPDTREAPVYDLSGLLRLADWLAALAVHNHSGDYRQFAPLLTGEGLPHDVADQLADASFFEQTHRPSKARRLLKRASADVNSASGLESPVRLFRPQLLEALGWADEERHYLRQLGLARRYLDKEDFLRASLGAYEAFISLLLVDKRGVNPDDFNHRTEARENYEKMGPATAERSAYFKLKHLRNALAHGTFPRDGSLVRALSNRTDLGGTLRKLFDELFPAAGRPG